MEENLTPAFYLIFAPSSSKIIPPAMRCNSRGRRRICVCLYPPSAPLSLRTCLLQHISLHHQSSLPSLLYARHNSVHFITLTKYSSSSEHTLSSPPIHWPNYVTFKQTLWFYSLSFYKPLSLSVSTSFLE